MAETITNAGAALLSQHHDNGTHLDIDQFVLAYIPGQNPADEIDKDRGLPPAEQVVHDQLIPEEHKGYMAPNMVSYSLFMGEKVGPFVFNTIYSVATGENDAVIKIVTLPDTHKIAEDIGDGIRGQAMVRNLVLEYNNASEITDITVEAEAWQLDFEKATTDHAGMGEVATVEEAKAGEDFWRWITPATLKAWWDGLDFSWDAITGKPDFKSAALLDAGQDDGQVALIGNAKNNGQTTAVIESGSNANGDYEVKSDGTIICAGSKFSSSLIMTVTLPIEMPKNNYLIKFSLSDATSNSLYVQSLFAPAAWRTTTSFQVQMYASNAPAVWSIDWEIRSRL